MDPPNQAEKSNPSPFLPEKDLIERWRNEAVTLQHEGPIQQFFDTSLNLLSCLIDQSTVFRKDKKALQRSHGMLRLWAHQYGMDDGTLETSLEQSVELRRATLEFLIPLSKILLRGLYVTYYRHPLLIAIRFRKHCAISPG